MAFGSTLMLTNTPAISRNGRTRTCTADLLTSLCAFAWPLPLIYVPIKCRSFPAVRLNLHPAIGFQYSYKSVLLSLPIYTPPWQVAVNRIVSFRELVVSITGLRDNGLVYDRPARKLDDKHPIKPEYRIPDYCQQYPDTSFLSRVKAERRDSNLH